VRGAQSGSLQAKAKDVGTVKAAVSLLALFAQLGAFNTDKADIGAGAKPPMAIADSSTSRVMAAQLSEKSESCS